MMATEKPILFSAAMIRAIQTGSKCQTRRVVKTAIQLTEDDECLGVSKKLGSAHFRNKKRRASTAPCKYGLVGDRLIMAMPIPSLNRNYCADVYGNIWSRARNKRTWIKLKGAKTSKGYLSVTPAVDGRYKTRLIHRLVAEAFYGFEPMGYKQVRHLDGQQLNNSPYNLDWGSQQDNWSDRIIHGRGSGEDHHAAKLTSAQVEEIRSSCAPQRYLSAKYKVSQSLIWAVKNNKIWVENPKPTPPNITPRIKAPCSLEITGIRIERLNDIKEDDAICEGVLPNCSSAVFKDGKWSVPENNGCPHQQTTGCDTCLEEGHFVEWLMYPDDADIEEPAYSAKESFQSLWDSINGKPKAGKPDYSWASNCYVWVVEFKKV